MYIHCLMHVPFEGPGVFERYYAKRGWRFEISRLYDNEPLPDLEAIDGLLLMGGPMGVYDEDKYSFLAKEKEFLRDAIDKGKKVIGICLGDQLIAAALGCKVYPGSAKEIGFWPVRLTEIGRKIWPTLPVEFVCFQWYGDTFDLPPGAQLVVEGRPVRNQAFIFGNALVFQFHLEITPKTVNSLITNCGKELDEKGEFIQHKNKLLNFSDYGSLHKILFSMLDVFYSDFWKDYIWKE